MLGMLLLRQHETALSFGSSRFSLIQTRRLTAEATPQAQSTSQVPQPPHVPAEGPPQRRPKKKKSPTLATDVVEGDRPPPEVIEKQVKELEEVRELLRQILADEPDREKYVMYLTKRGGRTWPVRSVAELETLVMFEVQSWRDTKIPYDIKQKILQYFVKKGRERRREWAKARVAAGGKFMPV